ncbi:MAG: hypothetical protein QG559_209 [Campylobacterota bacterium]|nr:hypothetical protein [Campylobacterota bacterium]
MDKKELYEEIDNTDGFTQKYFGISLVKFLLLICMVFGVGVYLGLLLYGTNSIEILLGLQEYQEYLQNEIARLKTENADLQREYFELKELSAK